MTPRWPTDEEELQRYLRRRLESEEATAAVPRRLNQHWKSISDVAPQLKRSVALSYCGEIALGTVFRPPDTTPHAKLAEHRDRLGDLAHLMVVEINKIKEVAPTTKYDAHRDALARLRDEIRSLPRPQRPARLPGDPPKHPGGSPEVIVERAKKRMAAIWVLELITKHANLVPTTKRNEPWVVLSQIFFEVAFGRHPSNMYGVCKSVKNEFLRRGIWDETISGWRRRD